MEMIDGHTTDPHSTKISIACSNPYIFVDERRCRHSVIKKKWSSHGHVVTGAKRIWCYLWSLNTSKVADGFARLKSSPVPFQIFFLIQLHPFG